MARMSEKTLKDLEAAIIAHHLDLTEDKSSPRGSAVVTGWVVAYEYSNLVDVDGAGMVVDFQNDYVTSDGSPNQHVGLVHWAVGELSDLFIDRDM